MDMDHIPSSWLMLVERQFIVNSIIRYMLPVGQDIQGSHHPCLLTWTKIKASATLPLYHGCFVGYCLSEWIHTVQLELCVVSPWPLLFMWPQGKSKQILSTVKLSAPLDSGSSAINNWEHVHFMLAF